jgi:hypothetical protein
VSVVESKSLFHAPIKLGLETFSGSAAQLANKSMATI